MSELDLRRLGRQLQKVVHDYNQVLCVVLAGVQLAALRDPGDTSQLAEELDSIERAARRAIALTQQLEALGDDLMRNASQVGGEV